MRTIGIGGRRSAQAALQVAHGGMPVLPLDGDRTKIEETKGSSGRSASSASRISHTHELAPRGLEVHPVTISLSLARVAATNSNDRYRSSWSAKAAGSSASEGIRNGMVLALIPANSMTGNSNPLTRCMVAKRTPLSGFSRPRSRIW